MLQATTEPDSTSLLGDAPVAAPTTPFYRLRWLLRMTHDTVLPAHHAAVIYALVARANRGREPDSQAIPDGLMIDAPEQCRTRLRAGELYAFGGTWLDPDPRELHQRVNRLTRGLRRIGRRGDRREAGLGGNFELAAVEDLTAACEPDESAGRRVDRGAAPQPVPIAHITAEIERLLPLAELTLRFTAPLRLERPKQLVTEGHRYFDRNSFYAAHFVQKLRERLPAVGVVRVDGTREPAVPAGPADLTLVDNRLVWLDIAWGPERKKLGGVVGRVRLAVRDPLVKAALVWGQYTRVGRNLHFGFGAYRIEQLRADPFACRRAVSLVKLAMETPELDVIARQSASPPGELRVATERVLDGSYTPNPHTIVEIRDGGGESRKLAIPSPVDRALQRAVLAQLAPGLDGLFETSSLAWRRGLGRHRAPARVLRAYRDGFRFTLRADFDRFFDRIEHAELEDRLNAYVADDGLVALVMMWVRAGMAGAGAAGSPPPSPRGIPTGAPLSPLLGNLMLDRFDELIESERRRLVRYGDDFLVLCRTRAEAESAYALAAAAAEQLRLGLNADDRPIHDFSEPFEFLGLRFTKLDRWHVADGRPRPIDEIAWCDASARRGAAAAHATLPGEAPESSVPAAVAVLGPDLAELDWSDGRLCYRYHGQDAQSAVLDELGSVVLVGPVSLSARVLDAVCQRRLAVLLADATGRVHGTIAEGSSDDAVALAAQVRAIDDPVRRLAVARLLVAAKLHNYAALGRATARRPDDAELPDAMEAAAAGAGAAESLESLRGVEGAAAARWYDRFDARLGPGFRFERRHAPDAEDPVNVLLNIGYSALYRWMIIAARAAGLSPVLGTLHTSDGRYAALAADLQEPFRHLIDRVVIQATFELKPSQFSRESAGPFALRIEHHAARQFQRMIYESFAVSVAARGQGEPVSYRDWFLRQARSLRRHLIDPAQPFLPFQH